MAWQHVWNCGWVGGWKCIIYYHNIYINNKTKPECQMNIFFTYWRWLLTSNYKLTYFSVFCSSFFVFIIYFHVTCRIHIIWTTLYLHSTVLMLSQKINICTVQSDNILSSHEQVYLILINNNNCLY